MPVPTHDITCSTRAYQTSCPSCNEDVWFFGCTCGSKIYFDFLGHPWEQHECREYKIRRELTIIQNVDKMSTDEIYKTIMNHEKKSGEELDSKIWDIIESEIGKRKSHLSIVEVSPDFKSGQYEEVVGEIMDYNSEVNIFKRLGYNPSNPMDEKLLRSKVKEEKWARAVVRTNPDRYNKCAEYNLFFSQAYAKRNPISKGMIILGIAHSRAHFRGAFWELLKHDLY